MSARLTAVVLLLALALPGCKKEPKAGEPCKTEAEAVCQGPQMMLSCTSGKWELTACHGPGGCAEQGGIVKCDETLAREGDPCGTPRGEHFACGVDQKTEMQCLNGKWKTVSRCRGPKGCQAKFPLVDCDTSIAMAGDVCGKQGNAACSQDEKSILECKDGKFVVTEKCDGKCKAQGLFVKCD